jgi:hypothetical protein
MAMVLDYRGFSSMAAMTRLALMRLPGARNWSWRTACMTRTKIPTKNHRVCLMSAKASRSARRSSVPICW